jgi:hypothetical protein
MAPASYDVGEPFDDTNPRIKFTKPTMTPLAAMGHGGVPVQGIPKFVSHTAQRQWTLEHLAGAFRVFGREGYAEGIAGHISVRDPEFSDRFWINPLAVHFSMMRVSDLICIDMQGNVMGGNRVSIESVSDKWVLAKFIVNTSERSRRLHSHSVPPCPSRCTCDLPCPLNVRKGVGIVRS